MPFSLRPPNERRADHSDDSLAMPRSMGLFPRVPDRELRQLVPRALAALEERRRRRRVACEAVVCNWCVALNGGTIGSLASPLASS